MSIWAWTIQLEQVSSLSNREMDFIHSYRERKMAEPKHLLFISDKQDHQQPHQKWWERLTSTLDGSWQRRWGRWCDCTCQYRWTWDQISYLQDPWGLRQTEEEEGELSGGSLDNLEHWHQSFQFYTLYTGDNNDNIRDSHCSFQSFTFSSMHYFWILNLVVLFPKC